MNVITTTLNEKLPSFLSASATGYILHRVITRFSPLHPLVSAGISIGGGIIYAYKDKPFAFLSGKASLKFKPWTVVSGLITIYVVANFASFIPWSLNPVASSSSLILAASYMSIRKDKSKIDATERALETFNVLTTAVSIGILAYPIIMHIAPCAFLNPTLSLTRGLGAYIALIAFQTTDTPKFI